MGFSLFGTLKHGKTDAEATGEADRFKPIDYPKPDGKLSFDRLTNVSFSMTNHEESQPCHLRLADPELPIRVNLPKYDEPAQRYCPAGVYEVVREDGQGAEVPDQLPELRALQDLRHQGSQPEHQLGHAAGWRRAELSQHVGARAGAPRPAIPGDASCIAFGAVRAKVRVGTTCQNGSNRVTARSRFASLAAAALAATT